MDTLTVTVSLLTALGGFELVKYLLNRRSNTRIVRAQASAEEFHALREYNEFLQQQLSASEARHADQTALVRRLNDELLTLTRDKSAAEAELSLKRCEVRSCPRRQPPSDF